MTFPNPPVATVRVARITQRDTMSGGEMSATRQKKLCSRLSTCHRW
jgi:hypothetical protein